MRRFLALVFLVACQTGVQRSTIDLSSTCTALSARACVCDDGAHGVAFCVDSEFAACDCRYVFESSLCPPDFQDGEDAKCVAERPSCSIISPDQTLNGVAVERGGARVSPIGAPYAASFIVETTAENGTEARITVEGLSFTAKVQDGRAVFASVILGSDGAHTLRAECKTERGVTADAAPISVLVDQTSPALSLSEPVPGEHFQAANDLDAAAPGVQIRACSIGSEVGTTFCVAIGASTPACTQDACVTLTCPGGAPFDVVATLSDAAGNMTTLTQMDVSCSLKTPQAQIISPTQSARVLTAAAGTGITDADPITFGAQAEVVVCSDVEGTATLNAGLPPSPLNPLASLPLQAATPGDGCPMGYTTVAHFMATLPQSVESVSGNLERSTQLRATIRDLSGEPGASQPVDLWVDTVPPIVSAYYPVPICGMHLSSAGPITFPSMQFYAEISPFTVTVSKTGSPSETFDFNYVAGPGIIEVANPGIVFPTGESTLTVNMVEPSGNPAIYPNCRVTVDNLPVLTWVAPTPSTTALNRASSSASPDWTGTLSVNVDLGGVVGATGGADAQVEFRAESTSLATVPCLATSASMCTASAVVTVPYEGQQITLVARVSDSVRGTKDFSRQLVVDTIAPLAPTGLTVSIADRRRTSFHLAWTAPLGASRYDIRRAPIGITGATGLSGSFETATVIPYPAPAKPAGSNEGIDVTDLLIEHDYSFAVAARDAAGNRSEPTVATLARASFIVEQVPSPAGPGMRFGDNVDGTFDFNQDGFSDLVVSSLASKMYVFYGSAVGYGTTPDIVFEGPAGTSFGFNSRVVGDMDGDGFLDFAIGAQTVGGDGGIYLFAGRSVWPSVVDASTAMSFIGVDSTRDPLFEGSSFGWPLSRLGDFDGDGADDFAAGAYYYGYEAGSTTIIRGTKPPELFPSFISLPDPQRTITIRGEYGEFGYTTIGLGPDEAGASPLVVFAPGDNPLPRAYLFRRPYAAGDILRDDADERLTGRFPVSNQLGCFEYATHGGYLNGSPMIAFNQPSTVAYVNLVSVYYGSSSGSLFGGSRVVLRDSRESTTFGSDFGRVLVGGGVEGTRTSKSFIGGPEPDLWVAALTEGPTTTDAGLLYLIDGRKLFTTARSVTEPAPELVMPMDADVVISAPSGWKGNWRHSLIPDADGDGYPDLAVSEMDYYGPPVDGRLFILR